MSLTPPSAQPTDRLIDLFDNNKPLNEILGLIDSENINVDKILLQTNSSVLSLAAFMGRLDVVKALVKRGAKLDEHNIKSALKGNELGIAIYLLKINKAEYVKNMDLLIGALPHETKEEQENVARINAIIDPKVKEQEVINSLIKSGLYKIDVSQYNIIRKFQIFLEIQRKKNPNAYPQLEEFIKTFTDGFCSGEVLLWLYLSDHGIEEPFWNDLKSFLVWSEDEADLEKTNEKGEKLESVYNQILANILGMFNPGSYYHLPIEQSEFGKIIALHTKNEDVVVDSVFSLLMTKEEMLIFLPELVQNEHMMRFANLDHTLGYLKGKFLDPNNPEGVQILNTPKKLIDEIDKAFSVPPGAFSPITLHRYAKIGSKPSYATKEEETKGKRDLLNRLYAYRQEQRKKRGENPDQIIDDQSPDGATLLYVASNRGDLETVRWCLEKGANMELVATYYDGGSESPLTGAARRGKADVVKLLLEKGANLFPKKSEQPFMSAVSYNRIDVVKVIIEHVKSVDKLNQQSTLQKLLGLEDGYTPLHYCISRGNMDIFDVLMEHGANINLGKRSPIVQTIMKGNPDVLRRILKYKDKIDIEELNKVFLFAIKNNKHVMVEELLKAGVSVDNSTLMTASDLKVDKTTLKILEAYDFKRRFSNALQSSPPPNYKSFKDFSQKGLLNGFPPFPDMIPTEQAGSYLQTAIDSFSFYPDDYQIIEFILNNSKFKLDSPIIDPKKKDSPKPLEIAIYNAIEDYQVEPEKTIERIKQLISLFIKKGLAVNQQKIEQFAKENGADPELLEQIRKVIANESTKRKAVVKSQPILSRLRAQSPPLLPKGDRPKLPSHKQKAKIQKESPPPSPTIAAAPNTLSPKAPSLPLPTSPRPINVFRARKATIQTDNERKTERADENQSAYLWNAIKNIVDDLASQSIDLNERSISILKDIQKNIKHLEESNPVDASKINLLSQFVENILNDPKIVGNVNPKVANLLDKIKTSSPTVPSNKRPNL